MINSLNCSYNNVSFGSNQRKARGSGRVVHAKKTSPRVSEIISDSYSLYRANLYRQKAGDVATINKAIKTFNDEYRFFKKIAQSSEFNLRTLGNKFYVVKDNVEHYNPCYFMDDVPELLTVQTKFGPCNVHYEKVDKNIPFSTYEKQVNIPVRVTTDEIFDKDGFLTDAETFIDFKNKTVMDDFHLLADGFCAKRAYIFDSRDDRKPHDFFHKIQQKFNAPISLNDVHVSPNGRITASSLVMYKLDKNNAIVSSRTYVNPVISPTGKNVFDYKKTGNFKIQSDYCYDTMFDGNRAKNINLYTKHSQLFERGIKNEKAESYLSLKRGNIAQVYLGYDQYDCIVEYRRKETVSLK